MRGIKGVLFDKDGTLLDYHETWMPANRAVALNLADGDADLAHALLVAGGWDPETDRVRSGSTLAAGDLEDIASLWTPLLPPRLRRERAEMVADLDRAFPENMNPTPVCDLPSFLDGLSAAGHRLGVATADSEAGLKASLAPFDILHRFDFTCGYDSGHGRKPEPGMVHAFLAATGLRAGAIVMVGDNRHDIEMGRAAGTWTVGVLTGTSSREELRAVGADMVVESISDLSGIL
jgi:phosphoglycolate phosphatase